jgi:hypothetical protein
MTTKGQGQGQGQGQKAEADSLPGMTTKKQLQLLWFGLVK